MAEGVLRNLKGEVVEVLDQPNRNGRIYSKELIENCVLNDKIVQEQLNSHSMFGMFNPSWDEYMVDMSKVSHCVTNLYIEDGKLKADIDILDTPQGNIVNEMLNNNVSIISTLNGRGDLRAEPDGKYLEVENYSFDYISLNIGEKKE